MLLLWNRGATRLTSKTLYDIILMSWFRLRHVSQTSWRARSTPQLPNSSARERKWFAKHWSITSGDLEDLRLGLERLQDPADSILDWEDVRRELLDQD